MRGKYKEGLSSPLLRKYKLQQRKSINDIHESSRIIKRNNLYKKMSVGNQELNMAVSQINKNNLNELIKEQDNIKEM